MTIHEEYLQLFCPICGALEMKDGLPVHPAQDKIIAEQLEKRFKTTYANADQRETVKRADAMTEPPLYQQSKEVTSSLDMASRQYHDIVHILNDFKNGATYTDTIGRIQFIISNLTVKHQEEMEKLIETVKQGLGEMAPNELLGVKLKRIYPFISHPTKDEMNQEECKHEKKYAIQCDEQCHCNLLHLCCEQCHEMVNTVRADFETYPASTTDVVERVKTAVTYALNEPEDIERVIRAIDALTQSNQEK